MICSQGDVLDEVSGDHAYMAGLEGMSQGLVVREHMKVSALEEVSKVLDGQINSQQFPIKGAVASVSPSRSSSWKRRKWVATFHRCTAGVPLLLLCQKHPSRERLVRLSGGRKEGWHLPELLSWR